MQILTDPADLSSVLGEMSSEELMKILKEENSK
jgi:hypothetical protein